MPVHKGIKTAALNRKARHDYFIEDTYECGIALMGTEVKSIRKGALNLKDSYAQVKNGELQEAALNRPPRNLTVGARIRIRYVPAIKNYANFLSIIESDTSENEMR